jgi:hypothetical protein
MVNKSERETAHKMDSVARSLTIHLHGVSVFAFKLVAHNKSRRVDVSSYRVELGLRTTVQLRINGTSPKKQRSSKGNGYVIKLYTG